ncbi:MAG: branched-chain amino acid ABC transporter substrate-binding protein [Deltaproteobacteria bacterium]|nr:MAG: branched-chain amino acid ABC transporter substrate-binding protein [Deltaproteobacteria bacterium]TMQ25416.1 MAG: branched-chain amino acid ABC transporter substrate-binding protein [Deltaproteobacteria bacterium]
MNGKRLGGKLTRRAFVQRALGAASGMAALGLVPGLGRAQTTKPIKIGVSLPLTGVFAIAGQKHRDGYQFWASLVNKDKKRQLLGRPVELIISDNRSDTETTVSQIERFVSENEVELLFGTFSSKLTFPASAAAEKAKMVYPVPAGGALKIWERGFQYIFYFQQNAAETIGQAPIDVLIHARDKKLIKPDDFPKSVGIVNADDFFSNAISAGLAGDAALAPGVLKNAGMSLAFRQKWPEGFTDWNTLANSLKGKNPDLVMACSASPDEAIQLVRAMRTVRFSPRGLYISQGSQAEFKQAVGEAANGIMTHAAWHAAAPYQGLLAGEKYTNQQFIKEFQAEHKREPDEDEAIPFAVCQGMEQAVRAVGSTDNQKLRSWLAARTKADPVRTVLGDFSWDKRGLPVGRPFLVLQWQKNKLEFLWPQSEFPGIKDVLWPKPKW